MILRSKNSHNSRRMIMKKFFALLMALILNICSIGCSNNVQPAESGSNSNKNSITSNVQPAESSSSVMNPSSEGDIITYYFGSIKDIHTYITTGSTDIKDYSAPMSHKLTNMPDPERIRFHGYYPIFDYFSFDESTFDRVAVTLRFPRGSVDYAYFLDNILVSIRPALSKSLFEFYLYIRNIEEKDVMEYDKNVKYTKGHVLRKISDCEIIYCYENGVIKTASFLIGNCFITLNGVCVSNLTDMSDDEFFANAYDKFMNDPDQALFSAFFSEDDDVLIKAFAQIGAN